LDRHFSISDKFLAKGAIMMGLRAAVPGFFARALKVRSVPAAAGAGLAARTPTDL
jgi:hypothetical protein